ncbi:MAG: sigma E protease regulator RseP [Gammaproteobacteria bacterium]|nr:sigma E protease regulator RseP [Gammaproteobacteria bacterium]
MFALVWNLFSFVVALGILVFVHEYGHFWVARRNGVKVLKFSVGFGRSIYSWTDKQGTEYSIGVIPLGGYVRMLDGRVDDVPTEQEQYSFIHKKVTQRIAIVAAGPLANFIFAIFALFLMLLIGVPKVKPVVGEVTPSSIAAEAGLQANDEFMRIADTKVLDWETTSYALLDQVGSDVFNVEVQRNGQPLTLTVKPIDWNIDDGQVLSGLGFTPYRPKPLLTMAQVVEGSPAQQAGIQAGDKLISMNGERLKDWPHAVSIITNHPEQTIPALIERNGIEISLNITPESKLDEEGFSQGYLGVAPNVENWPKGYVFDMQYGILPALEKSIERTWSLISLSFRMIGKLLVGDIGLNNLSGPISIAQGAGVSAQSGLVYFLSFLALISVNLGVVNLLPLPVLDGGHLMYFLIELIRGKPVSDKVQEIGFRVGAFVLMMIMGIAIINDFTRL